MNVFLAGGSGTIGIPLVRALVGEGHQVTALTRSTSRRDELRGLGAAVAVAADRPVYGANDLDSRLAVERKSEG